MATRSSQKRNKVPCGVCLGPVTDGKDEALLCEGQCGQWLHRGCASIPPSRYTELSTSSEPFICLSCSNLSLKQQIADLKEELKGSQELHSKVSKMEAEVSALRAVVVKLSSEGIKPPSKVPTTTRRPRPPRKSYATAAAVRPPQPRNTTTASISPPQPGQHGESRPKVKVEGARRVWGTMKTSSAGAILAAITKLISKKVDLRVKRKTKKSHNNKLLWWYVIHGAENDLIFLESEWEKIQNHTLWTLHNCHMTPKMPQPSTSVSPGATSAVTSQSVTEHVDAESMQYTDRGNSNNPNPVEQVPNNSSTIDATSPIDLSENPSDSEQVLTPTPTFTDLSQLPSQHIADHASDGQSSRA